MSKVNIKAILNNLTEQEIFKTNTKGIFIDNKLKYIDDSVTVILEIKDNVVTLDRTTNEYHVYMEFNKDVITKGIYEVKALGSFNLSVETNDLVINDNEINVMYSMYIDGAKQDFKYNIVYEEECL